MSLQAKRWAFALKRTLANEHGPIQAAWSNVEVVSLMRKACCAESAQIEGTGASKAVVDVLQKIVAESDVLAHGLESVVDELNSERIFILLRGAVLRALTAPTAADAVAVSALMKAFSTETTASAVGNRPSFSNNLNEPQLRELSIMVSICLDHVCSQSNDPVLPLQVASTLLLLLRKAYLNFANNKKAFAVLCDSLLTSSIDFLGHSDHMQTASGTSHHVKQIAHSINDLFQIVFFTDKNINELCSHSLSLANKDNSKKQKPNSKEDAVTPAAKGSSFSSRIFEVIEQQFQTLLSHSCTPELVHSQPLEVFGRGLSLFWDSLATAVRMAAESTVGSTANDVQVRNRAGDADDEGEKSDRKPNKRGREDSISHRKHIVHMIQFALSLMNACKPNTVNSNTTSDPFAGRWATVGVVNVQVALLTQLLLRLDNDSIPNHSSAEKLTKMLRSMWDDSAHHCDLLLREQMRLSASDDIRELTTTCHLLSGHMHCLRLLQLIDHRIALDKTRLVCSLLAGCDLANTKLLSGLLTKASNCFGPDFFVPRQSMDWSQCRSQLSIEPISASEAECLLSLLRALNSKYLLMRDLWTLFGRLRSLDTLLRSLLQRSNQCQQVDSVNNILGAERIMRSAELHEALLRLLSELPSAQWHKLWAIAFKSANSSAKSNENPDESEDVEASSRAGLSSRPLDTLSAMTLSLLFEAQLQVHKSSVKLSSSDQQLIENQQMDEHTHGLCQLLLFACKSLCCVDELRDGQFSEPQRKGLAGEEPVLDVWLCSLLRLVHCLMSYLVKVYVSDCSLLFLRVQLPVLHLEIVDGSSSDTREEEVEEVSIFELLQLQLMAVLSSQSKQSSVLYGEQLLETRLSLCQLLMNISAKRSSVSVHKEIQKLIKAVAQQIDESMTGAALGLQNEGKTHKEKKGNHKHKSQPPARESDTSRSMLLELSLLRTLLRNIHITRSLLQTPSADCLQNSITQLLMHVLKSTQLFSNQTASARPAPLEHNIYYLLESQPIRDAVQKLLPIALLNCMETSPASFPWTADAERLVMSQQFTSISECERLIHIAVSHLAQCAPQLDALEDECESPSTTPMDIYPKHLKSAAAAVRLLEHGLQSYYNLSSTSSSPSLHVHMECNMLILRLSEIADIISSMDEAVSSTCKRCAVLYLHLRFAHCLESHQTDNHMLQNLLESRFALDNHNLEHNRSKAKAFSWLLQVQHLTLQDFIRLLKSSDVHCSVVGTPMIQHVEALLATKSDASNVDCALSTCSLWISALDQLQIPLPASVTRSAVDRWSCLNHSNPFVGKSFAWPLGFAVLARHWTRSALTKNETGASSSVQLMEQMGRAVRSVLAAYCGRHGGNDDDDDRWDDECMLVSMRNGIVDTVLEILLEPSANIDIAVSVIRWLDVSRIDWTQEIRSLSNATTASRTKWQLCVLKIVSDVAVELLLRSSQLQFPGDFTMTIFESLLSHIAFLLQQALTDSCASQNDNNSVRAIENCGQVLRTISVALQRFLWTARHEKEVDANEDGDDRAVADADTKESEMYCNRMVKLWTKHLPSLALQYAERVNQQVVFYRKSVFHANVLLSTTLDVCQCVQHSLGVQHDLLLFATRGLVSSFLTKLGNLTMSLSLSVQSLTQLERLPLIIENRTRSCHSIEAEGAVLCLQATARQGMQLLVRVLTNMANVNDLERQLHLIVTVLVKTIADIAVSSRNKQHRAINTDEGKSETTETNDSTTQRTAQLSRSFKEIVYPGIFALFEKLNLKQKTQIFKLLDATTRVIMTDIHAEFMRSYKYQGN